MRAASAPLLHTQMHTQTGCIDLLALHRSDPARYPYLLASSARNPATGRFDILFAFPGQTLVLDPNGTNRGARSVAAGFLPAFDEWWLGQRCDSAGTPDIPFRGGWFVYLAYELTQEIEPRLRLPPSSENLPIAFATRIPAAIVVDHERQCTHLVAESDRSDCLAQLKQAVSAETKFQPAAPLPPLDDWQEDPAQTYLDHVVRIKEYIAAGDVFQVNLSRSWCGGWYVPQNPADVFARLALANPAPFAGLAVTPWGSIISSSPERLVRVRGRDVETRPIAGTRPRGGTPAQDQALSQTLLGHPKERAEHVMLIDLERNDLGRVCVPGSVRVDELMALESYAHVHHIVSNVRGTLRDGVGPADVLRAVFPGGTITGCPKVRCMEIIAKLEQSGRGAYTGAMGYVNCDGSMDFNILIRTLVLSASGQTLSLRAGAGIVADSDPQAELAETRAKARGLLRALQQDLGEVARGAGESV